MNGDGLAYSAATVGYDSPVVVDASLAVRPGEVVGLIGPNGSGKTTLVRAVTRSATVFAGDISVGGVSARSMSRRELARAVGVCPQESSAEFAFSARRYVEMGRHAHVSRFGDVGRADVAAVERAMDMTDTSRLSDERVDTLSGGDVQRLTLAQALAAEPRVLLLDEPTSHLDLNHRLQVLDVVGRCAADGAAALVVFHDLDLAARYADRIAVTAEGGLSVAGSPEDVLTAQTVADVFGVRAVIGTDPVTGAVTVVPVVREGSSATPVGVSAVVVSGSGSGAGVMRRLVLAGFDVATGALAAGDTDRDVAVALDVPVVGLAPFGEMSEADETTVRDVACRADVAVVCSTPVAAANLGNLRAVADAGRPTVLVGEMTEEHDFTGGEALALWGRLLSGGAIVCEDATQVTARVREAVGR